MKNIVILISLALFVLSCKTDKSERKYFYKANKNDNLALLSITIGENHFFGDYEIQYGKSGKDIGKVRGEIYGDTLKGKFRYLSFGGRDVIAPFVLLKHGEVLKHGNGLISSYLNIPFYIPESLEFSDKDFQFHKINQKSYEAYLSQ